MTNTAMIDRNHKLPITRQAEVLGISRGAVYYVPRPISNAELALMRRIDELHLEHPFIRDFPLETFKASKAA